MIYTYYKKERIQDVDWRLYEIHSPILFFTVTLTFRCHLGCIINT